MVMCYQGAKKIFKPFGGMLNKYSNYNNLMCSSPKICEEPHVIKTSCDQNFTKDLI